MCPGVAERAQVLTREYSCYLDSTDATQRVRVLPREYRCYLESTGVGERVYTGVAGQRLWPWTRWWKHGSGQRSHFEVMQSGGPFEKRRGTRVSACRAGELVTTSPLAKLPQSAADAHGVTLMYVLY